MIGGDDIVFHCLSRPSTDEWLDAIQEIWPDAVFEDDDERGIFCYENASSKKLWDHGLGEGYKAQMIHLIFGPGEEMVTLVCDNYLNRMMNLFRRLAGKK